MKFIAKIDSYMNAYSNSNNKEGMLKIASEDGITPTELTAYHNLVYGNMFTGENLIKTAKESNDSKIIQLGQALDKVASEEMSFDSIYQVGAELGMDAEDVDFVLDNIEKQAQEAGIVLEENNVPIIDKVAEAMDYLESNGIDPMDALVMASNMGEDNLLLDEKVASEAEMIGYTPEHLNIIAEAFSYTGLDEKVASVMEELYLRANQ